MCSESKAFSLSREGRSDDQILSCLLVEPLSTANRGGVLFSVSHVSHVSHSAAHKAYMCAVQRDCTSKKGKQGNVEIITDEFIIYTHSTC